MKSGCVLIDVVTLDQWRNHDFVDTQSKRDFLVGVIYLMNAEGHLLQIESPFQILRNREVCETRGPNDNELSKMHEAEVHVFSNSLLWLGKSAMNESEMKFTERWKEHLVHYKESARRSNKGTGGMESSVVLFKPCIHLFACWFVMTGWRTSISRQPFVQTRLDCGSLSVYMHQSPALCFKHVWIVVPCLCTCISLHPFVQTRLDCGSLSVYKHQSTARVQTRLDCGSLLYTSISFHSVFQTRLNCGSLFAYTHQFPALCFKHVWIVVPCLGTSICLLLPWSNTFGFWFLVVYKHQSPGTIIKHVLIIVPGLRTH